MAKKKIIKKVIDDGEYKVFMNIAKDRRSFYVRISSGDRMDDGDIVLAIEEWLYNNILDGYWPNNEVEH